MILLQTTKKILKAVLPILILGALILVYHNYNPTLASFYLPCPLYYTTDIYCTGCGSQRAIHHLLHFEIGKAFSYNLFLVLSFPLLIYAVGVQYINFVWNTKFRIKLFYSNAFIFIYFGLAVLYMILRNLDIPPFNYLAPG